MDKFPSWTIDWIHNERNLYLIPVACIHKIQIHGLEKRIFNFIDYYLLLTDCIISACDFLNLTYFSFVTLSRMISTFNLPRSVWVSSLEEYKSCEVIHDKGILQESLTPYAMHIIWKANLWNINYIIPLVLMPYWINRICLYSLSHGLDMSFTVHLQNAWQLSNFSEEIDKIFTLICQCHFNWNV